MARGSTSHYHVRPRYTCGSPAQVDERTAQTVAIEEREAHERVLTGAFGEDDRLKAEREGLDGIAYIMTEHPKHWLVEDLITHRVSVKPFETFNVSSKLVDHHQCARCASYRAQHDGVPIELPRYHFVVGDRVNYNGHYGVVETVNAAAITVRYESGDFSYVDPAAAPRLLRRLS